MKKNSYKEFSQIYDILMDDVDYNKWVSFIKNKLRSSKNILEAACGTGNITTILLEDNYKVTAFDISSDMLMRAYEKIRKNSAVKLLNQDMVNFSIADKFDCALCCCDGVNYIDINKVSLFFQNIYNHLCEEGIFIFDISTEYKYNVLFNETYVYDDENIFYVWENFFDDNNKYVNMEINFFVKESFEKYHRITEQQIQYIHKIEEIKIELEKIGFKNIRIYDDYNENTVNNNSLRAVFVVEK